MKRLDVIANWFFENSEYNVSKKGNGWPGYTLYFYPSNEKYIYFGKITIDFKNIPNNKTIKIATLKEIKRRCLDKGWYNSGFKRLLRDKKLMKEIYNEKT